MITYKGKCARGSVVSGSINYAVDVTGEGDVEIRIRAGYFHFYGSDADLTRDLAKAFAAAAAVVTPKERHTETLDEINRNFGRVEVVKAIEERRQAELAKVNAIYDKLAAEA